jgi:hypothetical protein
MAEIDVDFCFYDDPDVGGDPPDYVNSRDADRYSTRLRESHRDLWSKKLPDGNLLTLRPNDDGWLDVSSPHSLASIGFRLSSDTIATPHERYQGRGMHLLWGALPAADRSNYKRRFYTIGGFIVFPRRLGSINVSRGSWTGSVQDRFDLTLECIRRYYVDETDASVNPLGAVLLADSKFFELFGHGAEGFAAYTKFFHLDGLVRDGQVRMFDDFDGGPWEFSNPPLPASTEAYRRYLDNVLSFVDERNASIDRAMRHGT